MSSYSDLRNSRRWRFVFLSAVLAALVVMTGLKSSSGQERELPDGPGKEETRKLCAGCHELEKTISVRQDRVGWQQTMDKMVASGLKGADQQINAVLEYLVKHFPADEVPKININQATAIELESGLSLRRSQAAAIIEHRGRYGKFKTIEDLKNVPGVDIAKIEAKKDRLTFEE